MTRRYWLFGIVFALGLMVGFLMTPTSSAQDPLKMGTILQRTDLVAAKGLEAVLVLREVPPGGASGKHTQSGNEIVYILDGSVVFEAEGKPPVTLKAGQTFTTVAGEVHNVKNGSTTAGTKALAFYIAKKGTALEDLSLSGK